MLVLHPRVVRQHHEGAARAHEAGLRRGAIFVCVQVRGHLRAEGVEQDRSAGGGVHAVIVHVDLVLVVPVRVRVLRVEVDDRAVLEQRGPEAGGVQLVQAVPEVAASAPSQGLSTPPHS